MNEESLFAAASALPPGSDRNALLDRECGDDDALRRRLEQLLAAHDAGTGILDRDGAAERTVIRPPEPEADSAGPRGGTIVAGRYKLLEQIGEGGMGTVWVAEQTEPVRRKVALKLIKAGMDSRSVIARFEAERQALALMDHPNIARVLDGGMTSQGRPYFVMEYVKGVPLTQYCDDARLTVEERLQLFIPVCQAVQHAHQKGIIHRDLKPTNILVCLYDGKPVPKVIDFGLAKAMHQSLTDYTLYTAHGMMLGTPLYMSPEQAELNNLDIDTRTDIYALGVVLYELLTGTTPLEKQQFQQAAWQEMVRLIKEVEPPRPSLRLSGSGSLPNIAAQRRLEPVKLSRLLRGELDWVVLKALEKDRNRRYETANGFAADIQRYLDGEPVTAVPPSTLYRLRKFGRRYGVILSTAAAFAAILFVATAVSGWLAVRATRAEAIAEDKRNEAEANAEEAGYNLGLAHAAQEALTVALADTRLTADSLQIDANVAEISTDQRVGILQVAQTLNSIDGPGCSPLAVERNLPERRQRLIEFATMAVLTHGQSFTTLLPPLTHDTVRIVQSEISSDRRRVITLGEDHTARLWDTRTGRLIAILRQGAEQVVNCGISPDGNTAFTDDRQSVARFWDTSGGELRASTEPRPDRYQVPTGDEFLFRRSVKVGSRNCELTTSSVATIRADRLLTRPLVSANTPAESGQGGSPRPGPVELWDTASGKCVARLDGPTVATEWFQFLGDGRWVATCAGNTTVVVFSSVDGKEVARLDDGEDVSGDIWVSPSGIRLATRATRGLLRSWETASWKPELWKVRDTPTRFVTDDAIETENDGFPPYRYDVYVDRNPTPVVSTVGMDRPHYRNAMVCVKRGQIFDLRTGRRVSAPAGARYPEAMSQFTTDGRFAFIGADGFHELLIDTKAGKQLTLNDSISWLADSPMSHLGTIGVDRDGYRLLLGVDIADELRFRVLPMEAYLDITSYALRLWAQVAVRGSLDDDGEFVKWDEHAWEKKRQELAAVPPPHPDFPFPGHVAHDKRHWLRREYEEAPAEDKPRLAQELLRRAEASGDRAEAARWRRTLAPSNQPADAGP